MVRPSFGPSRGAPHGAAAAPSRAAPGGRSLSAGSYTLRVILNSSLQVALGLTPMLVLLSLVGGAHPTLVLPPLLLVALALTAGLSALIVDDGESTWLAGVFPIGLYGVIAASFWWG
jgi:Ca2+:H+ antiporter